MAGAAPPRAPRQHRGTSKEPTFESYDPTNPEHRRIARDYERHVQEYEGFGAGDPDSPRAQGAKAPESPRFPPSARTPPTSTTRSPSSSPKRRPGGTGGRSGGTTVSSVTEDAGGFLLGLFGYALLIQYLRGGPSQVRAWLAAKFVNKTVAPPAAATPPPPWFGGSPSQGGGPEVTPPPAPGNGFITPGTTTSPPTSRLG